MSRQNLLHFGLIQSSRLSAISSELFPRLSHSWAKSFGGAGGNLRYLRTSIGSLRWGQHSVL